MKKTMSIVPGSSSSDGVVLFVDDDDAALKASRRLLRSDPLTVLTAPSGLHALDLLKTTEVHVIVSDYFMPGMDGVTLLDEVARLYPQIGRMLLTAAPDSEIIWDARRHLVLTKGMDPGLIRQLILREVKHHGG